MTNTDDKPDAKLQFGRSLHHWRKRAGQSQEDLANTVGKSQQWLAKVERGDQSPKLEDAQDLADTLGVPLRSLIGGTDRDGHHDRDVWAIGDHEGDSCRAERSAAPGQGVGQTQRRSREATRAKLQSDLDTATIEQNQVELELGYWNQQMQDLSRRLPQQRERLNDGQHQAT